MIHDSCAMHKKIMCCAETSHLFSTQMSSTLCCAVLCCAVLCCAVLRCATMSATMSATYVEMSSTHLNLTQHRSAQRLLRHLKPIMCTFSTWHKSLPSVDVQSTIASVFEFWSADLTSAWKATFSHDQPSVQGTTKRLQYTFLPRPRPYPVMGLAHWLLI